MEKEATPLRPKFWSSSNLVPTIAGMLALTSAQLQPCSKLLSSRKNRGES